MTAKIERIEAFPINYAVVGRFKFFEGPKGRPDGRPAVVVKITSEDGTVGWGQSVPSQRWSYETVESVYTTIENYLAPDLIGLDVCLEALREVATEVLDEEAARDEHFARILASQRAFSDTYGYWKRKGYLPRDF